MDGRKDTAIEAVLEHLIEHGPDDIATVFGRAFELAMQIERERFLRAGAYERTAERRGYANGYKPKRIDTPAGTVGVQVPKTAGHEGAPFYPQSLERGRRSMRAVMLAVAEMYIKGVSTREVEAVMREFGIESLSSSQVSRAAKLLDDELEAWRTRLLGEIRYLILDARYEKMRHSGIVRGPAQDPRPAAVREYAMSTVLVRQAGAFPNASAACPSAAPMAVEGVFLMPLSFMAMAPAMLTSGSALLRRIVPQTVRWALAGVAAPAER